MAAKPGDVLIYHGKPWAILIAHGTEYEDIWLTYVPSIRKMYTHRGPILVDPLPRDHWDIMPSPEALGLVINRSGNPEW